CDGPLSPGEHLVVRSSLTYEMGRSRQVAWGLKFLAGPSASAPWISPYVTKHVRSLSGQGDLIRSDRFAVVAGPPASGAVRAVTWAGVGSRAPALSEARRLA